MEQTCESMDKNRIEGARAGRAGDLPQRPYPSRVRCVDPATVHGRRLHLPQEICVVSLRRLRPSGGGLTAAQKSAEGVVGGGHEPDIRKPHRAEGPNEEEWLVDHGSHG